jgi:hypothetical protein
MNGWLGFARELSQLDLQIKGLAGFSDLALYRGSDNNHNHPRAPQQPIIVQTMLGRTIHTNPMEVWAWLLNRQYLI